MIDSLVPCERSPHSTLAATQRQHPSARVGRPSYANVEPRPTNPSLYLSAIQAATALQSMARRRVATRRLTVRRSSAYQQLWESLEGVASTLTAGTGGVVDLTALTPLYDGRATTPLRQLRESKRTKLGGRLQRRPLVLIGNVD